MIPFTRKCFCISTMMLMVLAAIPTPANARSFWEVFFGKKEEQVGPPPEETLQAPFSPKPQGKATSKKDAELRNIYEMSRKPDEEKEKTLAEPNMSQEKVAMWAAGVAAEAMTIDPSKFEAAQKELVKKFTPYAYQEYKKYLEGINLVTSLKASNLMMQAIAPDGGTVTRQGAIDGTYHWLSETNLMTTFYTPGTVKIDKKANTQSQSILVEVQIGRVRAETPTDPGIAIERWRVTSTK